MDCGSIAVYSVLVVGGCQSLKPFITSLREASMYTTCVFVLPYTFTRAALPSGGIVQYTVFVRWNFPVVF